MDFSGWRALLGETATQLLQRVVTYVPNLLGALALFLLGLLLALATRSSLRRLVSASLSGLARKGRIGEALDRTGLRERIPRFASVTAYWVVLLFFAAIAIERLELSVATALLGGLLRLLPQILLGLVIVLGSILAGTIAYSAVVTAATSAKVAYASILGRAAQSLVVLVGFLMGADLMGIQSQLLTVILAILVGTSLGGAALAFGLGSGLTASNIISAYYLLKTYRPGQRVRIGGFQGKILEITQTGALLDTPEGQVLVPARKFAEEASVLLPADQ